MANLQIADNLDDELRKNVTAALQKIAAKQTRLRIYNEYYEGEHSLNFASEKFKTMFGRRLQKFCINLCKIVVKAPADRLEIIGFDQEGDKTFRDASWKFWKASQMPKLTKRVHREAFKTGDAFVIVFTDPKNRVRIWPQDSRNCAVWYDDETGEIIRGAKLWRGSAQKDFVYLNLYYPGRIERYQTRNPQAAGNTPTTAGAFVKRMEGDGENWPVEFDSETCPMFHFGLEGSLLDDVIPINDGLNKTISDMLVSSEANAIRQRWTAGIQYEIDPETGKQIAPFSDDAKWIGSESESAKFGEFSQSKLEDYLKVAEALKLDIANVAGIPAWYLKPDLGSFPSGEALTKSEAKFTSLIKDAQNDFGETWAAVVRFASFLQGDAPKETEIETQWTPAAATSPRETLDLATIKKNLGVSETRNLSEIGYTDEEIKKMQTENDQKAKDAAESFGSVFDTGLKAAGGA